MALLVADQRVRVRVCALSGMKWLLGADKR